MLQLFAFHMSQIYCVKMLGLRHYTRCPPPAEVEQCCLCHQWRSSFASAQPCQYETVTVLPRLL